MARRFSPLLLLLLAVGCGGGLRVETPAGFVELEEEDSRYHYRATTADGLVLAAREIPHEPKGSLEFWTKATENKLRDRGGYSLLEKKPAKTSGGLEGTTLRFGHDEGRTPHLYQVSLFVTEKAIVVFEVGGRKELVEASEKEIAAALGSLQLD